ncbi:MAG TPA: hypothetical protein VLK29_01930 [Luteimonas sp.]|nr:hypothetical protein [Luteimonas sp.]
MTNSKYRVVIMLNCLERCLRNLRSANASVADMERILLPEATAILRVSAKADVPYVRSRLEYMLDQAGVSGRVLEGPVRSAHAMPRDGLTGVTAAAA